MSTRRLSALAFPRSALRPSAPLHRFALRASFARALPRSALRPSAPLHRFALRASFARALFLVLSLWALLARGEPPATPSATPPASPANPLVLDAMPLLGPAAP